MKNRARFLLPIVVATTAFFAPRLALAQEWEEPTAEPAPPQPEPAPPPEPEPAPPSKPPAAKAAPERTPPKIDVTAPEPAATPARSFHVHDGFYLRLNIGLSAHGASFEDDVDARGGALGFDALVGGSPSRGVAIGGGLMSDYGPNLKLERNGRKVGEANLETAMLGAFIDGFPDPKGGFHLGGLLGLANIRADVEGGDQQDYRGIGGSAWMGYDWWVGDEWSVGALLRLTSAVGRWEKGGDERDAMSTALDLMFTALYH